MIPTIKKNKVAIFSDLHLGVHSNSSEWHKYAIEWANWFREECRDKGIKDLIFCGDWHHNRSEISVNTLQVSADILDMFEEFNLIAITGNHDIYYNAFLTKYFSKSVKFSEFVRNLSEMLTSN